MLHPTYPIRTERLALRPYVASDFDDALEYWGREDLARYLYLDSYTRETFGERLELLAGRTAIEQEGDVITLALVPDGVGRVVGDVTFMYLSELHRHGEIGFMLHPDFQGRGLATEASEPLLRLGFEEMELHRITGRLDGRNDASGAVLSRLGMRLEAHLVENEWVKGEWTDEKIYAILRTEWLAHQA